MILGEVSIIETPWTGVSRELKLTHLHSRVFSSPKFSELFLAQQGPTGGVNIIRDALDDQSTDRLLLNASSQMTGTVPYIMRSDLYAGAGKRNLQKVL